MRKAIIQNIIIPANTPRAGAVGEKEVKSVLSKYTKEVMTPKELSPREEAFCQFYVNSMELRGNGTKCYAVAWGHDLDALSRENEKRGSNGGLAEIPKTSQYDRACAVYAVLASRLLIKVKINERLVELLNDTLTDTLVDSRLAHWILSDNPRASVSAIQEYNKLRQRITQKSQVHTRHEMLGIVRHIYEEADRIDEENKRKDVLEGENAYSYK